MVTLSVLEYEFIRERLNANEDGLEANADSRVPSLSPADIEELYSLTKKTGFGRLIQTERHGLRFGGYCGVIRTELGTEIEVLPKTTTSNADEEEKEKSRRFLIKMLNTVYDVTNLPVGEAGVNVANNRPLLEVYIAKFLQVVADITHKGIKRAYTLQQGTLPIVKGRLRMNEQSRRMPHQQHINYVEFSEYVYDRPENRLIAYCLRLVGKWTDSIENKKLTKQLSAAFECVSASTAVNADFQSWSLKRDMRYYEPAKQWVEMIIRFSTPYAIKGRHNGPSLMLQTDKLFEEYIAIKLREYMADSHDLVLQGTGIHLMREPQTNKGRYVLKPDYMFSNQGAPAAILDAKWKLVTHADFSDENSDSSSEGLTARGMTENDLRQMFVYAHKYMKGKGDLILIYPKHNGFPKTKSYFNMNNKDLEKEQLRLWVVPFDLVSDRLLLPESLQEKPFFR